MLPTDSQATFTGENGECPYPGRFRSCVFTFPASVTTLKASIIDTDPSSHPMMFGSFFDMTRARRFEEQLQFMKRVWSGEAVGERVGKIGLPTVQPGGPEVLIGGYSPAAASRASGFADGFIAGGGLDAQGVASLYKVVEDSWKTTGRKGRPRLVCPAYYQIVLGDRSRRVCALAVHCGT